MIIKLNDLDSPGIITLLQQHLADMRSVSPPESVHALDLQALKHPSVTFWSAWVNESPVACGALKALNSFEGEIKSMRVSEAFRGQGIAQKIYQCIFNEATKRGYKKLLLETGSVEFFAPARAFYEKLGFRYRGPFADYSMDPFSSFMEIQLA